MNLVHKRRERHTSSIHESGHVRAADVGESQLQRETCYWLRPMAELNLVSLNVNGLRAADRKGFAAWLRKIRPSVLGVQEVRASWSQLPKRVRSPTGYTTFFLPAARPGYSGVGLYVRADLAHAPEFCFACLDRLELVPQAPGQCLACMDIAEGGVAREAQASPLGSEGARAVGATSVQSWDDEGRAVAVRLGQLTVFSVYFPNGNGKLRDNSRVPFKLGFTARIRQLAEAERAQGRTVVVMGDFNTAPTEWDLARPKQNEDTSGFLPNERAAVAEWLAAGWVDSLRAIIPAPQPREVEQLVQAAKAAGLRKAERAPHPGEGLYTWWSQRAGVRAKNIGWRIDLALVSSPLKNAIRSAATHPDVFLSDHCPISVGLAPSVLKKKRR